MLIYLSQILEQACLMFPLVLGIYLSFSVLKIADLTVDGSLVLGAAVFARLLSSNVNIFIAMMVAVFAGMFSGVLVALVQRKNRIDPLIAGILMAFILNSLSLVIMQRPNIGLIGINFLAHRGILLGVLILALSLFLSLFLMARAGLWLKAFGNNPNLVAMLGRDPEFLRMIGLSLSNGLAALSGCLLAQAGGYADVNMGFGQALIGIAMILVGRQLLHIFKQSDLINDAIAIAFTFLGVLMYFVLTNEVIRYGLSPVYLKMAIGALLIIFLLLASDRATHGRSTLS